jgi:hypothetical protein
VTATAHCRSLRFAGVLDAEGHRCDQPEDDPVHDPLGPVDRHVFDPAPNIEDDQT